MKEIHLLSIQPECAVSAGTRKDFEKALQHWLLLALCEEGLLQQCQYTRALKQLHI